MLNSLLLLSLFVVLFADIKGAKNVTRYDDSKKVKNRREFRVHHNYNEQNSGRRIIGGMKAKKGEFPFQALLKYDDKFDCSASIIHIRWLLTAAHCLHESKIDKASIIVGTNNLHGEDGKTYEPELFIIHEGYHHIPEKWNGGLEYVVNDIGLIRLKANLDFNTNVKPVKLPRLGNTRNYVNEWVTISGWGRIHWRSPMSEDLLVAHVKVLPQADCRAVWSYIKNDHICTKINPTSGSCNGDSGGPLTTYNGIQIGIVSTGDTYCEHKKPDLFTKISSFVHWIRKQLAQYGESLA